MADYVARLVGTALHVSTATITFWTSQTGGVQITDLTDQDGDAISVVVTTATGQIPVFFGPDDDSNTMWADAGGTQRLIMGASDTEAFIGANFLTADQIQTLIQNGVVWR